jgi:hypothetical protein
VLPSANEISNTRDFWCSLISVGLGVFLPGSGMAVILHRIAASFEKDWRAAT